MDREFLLVVSKFLVTFLLGFVTGALAKKLATSIADSSRRETAIVPTHIATQDGQSNVSNEGNGDNGSELFEEDSRRDWFEEDYLTDESAVINITHEPWLIKYQHNASQRIFRMLPDELQLRWMSCLPDEDLRVLRGTSKRFRTIIDSDPDLSPEIPLRSLYRIPRTQTPDSKERMRQSLYCDGCRLLFQDHRLYKHKVRAIYTNIWCSGCVEVHPAMLFSHAERYKPDNERICIGREGGVRLCSHRVVRWLEFQRIHMDLAAQPNRSCTPTDVVWCKDKSHMPKVTRAALKSLPPWFHPSHREAGWIYPTLQYTVGPGHGILEFNTNTTLILAADSYKIQKEHLVQALHNVPNPPHLCPHMTFTDERIIAALPNSSCICLMNDPEPKWRGGSCVDRKHKVECPEKSCMMSVEIIVQRRGSGSSGVREVNVCSQRGRCDPKPSGRSWVSLLDPSTYNLYSDPDSQHLTWCPDPECSTNYLGIRRCKFYFRNGQVVD